MNKYENSWIYGYEGFCGCEICSRDFWSSPEATRFEANICPDCRTKTELTDRGRCAVKAERVDDAVISPARHIRLGWNPKYI